MFDIQSAVYQYYTYIYTCMYVDGRVHLECYAVATVSFAEYRLFYRSLLQKRPIILSILLTVATPYAFDIQSHLYTDTTYRYTHTYTCIHAYTNMVIYVIYIQSRCFLQSTTFLKDKTCMFQHGYI